MIQFDPAKRALTLQHRGLDFKDAARVFQTCGLTMQDERRNYGETRYITLGWLNERWVVVVWTMRQEQRRIISMRHANEREIEKVERGLDRPR